VLKIPILLTLPTYLLLQGPDLGEELRSGFPTAEREPIWLLFMAHAIENADISSVIRYQAQEYVRAMALIHNKWTSHITVAAQSSIHVTLWLCRVTLGSSGPSGEEASGIRVIIKVVSTRLHLDLVAGVTGDHAVSAFPDILHQRAYYLATCTLMFHLFPNCGS
jgi:hypothetical protein